MALRWGIASAGLISHDFVSALSTLPKGDHIVRAVAARSLSSAEEFAARHGIPKAFEGYEALAKDDEIEAVYVGAQNPQHLDICLMLLDHGKHVLCEKPLCVNEAQVKTVLNRAQEKKLFLMEALWSRFFPSYQYLRSQIDSGELGTVQSVDVEFGFKLDHVERMAKKAQGGGTILDLGVYTIQASLWAFGGEEPESIVATGALNDDGCDMEMKGELRFKNGRVARIQTSALATLKNTMTVTGTKGKITVPEFWSPQTLIDVDGSTKEWLLPEADQKFNFLNSCGLRFEAEEVRKCIRAGKLQSEHSSHEESLKIARIEDELRRQIGVKYSWD